MHLGRHIIQQLVLEFGEPAVERWSFEMRRDEFEHLRAVVSRGRAHDVTLLIALGDRVVVIRKPNYPPGAYRTPSGGVHPEESFLDGARREAFEETGLEVSLERYLLRAHVGFVFEGTQVDWTTHVMAARPLRGEVRPVDTREIEDARWIGWSELLNQVNPILVASGRGGLRYRAELHVKCHALATEERARAGGLPRGASRR
jgi:8-oxo-dGTP pyrophosphatase MutT (NUDIX family)